jgi:hypothetical protein
MESKPVEIPGHDAIARNGYGAPALHADIPRSPAENVFLASKSPRTFLNHKPVADNSETASVPPHSSNAPLDAAVGRAQPLKSQIHYRRTSCSSRRATPCHPWRSGRTLHRLKNWPRDFHISSRTNRRGDGIRSVLCRRRPRVSSGG